MSRTESKRHAGKRKAKKRGDGSPVPAVENHEFLQLNKEAEESLATTDWRGKFVPGLKNLELAEERVPIAWLWCTNSS